ncbi:MAG: LysR family transcriptional regulator [Alphaproteobacteria bacterium]|nr:MAG: LysR family transcriptional regulator [Alphaproteobacteria bacterium]
MNKHPFNINMLNVQQLNSFVIVYEQSSYSAASRIIGLSVPTIWEQVRSLESIYQTLLFKKSGRRIVATDNAKLLYEAVDPILNSLESTFDIVQQGENAGNEMITIVTGIRMMLEDLALPLAQFREQKPNVRLRINQGNDATAEELILADEVDLAFSLEPGLDQESKKLHYEPVYSIDLMAVAPMDHAFSKLKRFSLKELAQFELVIGEPRTHVRQSLDEAFHRLDLKARIAVETDTSAFTVACVQAGMGVGVLAGHEKGSLTSNLKVRSLKKQLGQRRIMVMWKKGRQLPASMKMLLNCIKESQN